jgi:hypothetical protein
MTSRGRWQHLPFAIWLLLAATAWAQDVRTVTSPNGDLEFRVFVGQPPGSGLTRIGYQVYYHGKPIIGTSYLGIDIVRQEPLLGEYIGLTGSDTTKGTGYNELRVNYMQNGSLGRLVTIQARAYDRKVVFRYVVPPSTPLAEPFTIDDEKTQFAVEPDAVRMIKITEDTDGSYPSMTLLPEGDSVLVTRLDEQFNATTPLTTPWRIISILPGY